MKTLTFPTKIDLESASTFSSKVGKVNPPTKINS